MTYIHVYKHKSCIPYQDVTIFYRNVIFDRNVIIDRYVIFAVKRRQEIKVTNPELGFSEVTRLLGQEWSNLPHDEKEVSAVVFDSFVARLQIYSGLQICDIHTSCMILVKVSGFSKIKANKLGRHLKLVLLGSLVTFDLSISRSECFVSRLYCLQQFLVAWHFDNISI